MNPTTTTQPNAAQLWPEAQRIITEKALAGTLTEAQRREAIWKGFDVPARAVWEIKFWSPPPAPITTADDLTAMLAGAPGCYSVPQILQLPSTHPTRWAYDHPERSYKMGSLFAQGRAWACDVNPWDKARGVQLSEGTARNGARRVKFEQERAERATKAAQAKAAAQPPLTALFFGKEEATPIAPRYTTPEQANQHTLKHRQNWQAGMRDHRARRLREVRAELGRETQETLTLWYTLWQRRGGGFDPSYMLEFIRTQRKLRDENNPPAAQ